MVNSLDANKHLMLVVYKIHYSTSALLPDQPLPKYRNYPEQWPRNLAFLSMNQPSVANLRHKLFSPSNHIPGPRREFIWRTQHLQTKPDLQVDNMLIASWDLKFSTVKHITAIVLGVHKDGMHNGSRIGLVWNSKKRRKVEFETTNPQG